MFDLVVDVDSYHEFIPYCTASRINSRTAQTNGDTQIQADLVIAYKFLHEKYSSSIIAAHDKSGLLVQQKVGPFRQLHNQWQFSDKREGGCRIDFDLQFVFAVPLLGRLIQPIMPRVVARFIDSFETRAATLY